MALTLQDLEKIEAALTSSDDMLMVESVKLIRREIWNYQRALRNHERKLVEEAEAAGRVTRSQPYVKPQASRLRTTLEQAQTGAELLAELGIDL